VQEAYIGLNPLIRSTVHETFHRAVNSIGLPDFPQDVFFEEITPYLRSPQSPFEENEKLKLWNAIMHGEIIATEAWENTHVFYVRGMVGTRVIDIRLIHKDHEWHIQSVISMGVRPFFRVPLIQRLAVIAAVVVAAVLGYSFHHPAQGPSVVANRSSLGSSNIATQDNKPALPSHSSVDSSVDAKKPQVQTISFTLAHGMSLHELSKFLYAHHLVKGAVHFDMVLKRTGIDRHLKPGTYTFKTDMTENQILQALQHGPSK
jgi:hypothetical protein